MEQLQQPQKHSQVQDYPDLPPSTPVTLNIDQSKFGELLYCTLTNLYSICLVNQVERPEKRESSTRESRNYSKASQKKNPCNPT